MVSLRALGFAALLVTVVSGTSGARAQAVLALEGNGAMPLSAPQSKLFGAGGGASVAGYYRAAPWLLLGARLRGGLLANGDPPADKGRVDPGTGTFETLSAMLLLRPFAKASEPRSAVGVFLEGGAGGVLTGKLARPGLEAGVGWGFPVGSFALAPVLRYVQVVQGSNALSSEDARLFLFGAELAVLDTHPAPPAPKAAEVVEQSHDRDEDGVSDDDDACPDSPEDRDGWKDEDGCPDPDNDADGIADEKDRCPNEAEDKDGFEDEDGCPDPDNDKDGFLDKDDQCPNEAEVVNGNKDYDGCPDEGLIEFRNDRIVLEERVLFDFERSRIKSAARPILAAIMNLYSQHPEWTKIRIEGHADQRGNEEYNQKLSEERAHHVLDALVKLGIPAATIESVGYGSQHPRDMREEEAAYARNRRVEFVVVTRKEVPVEGQTPTPAEAALKGSAAAPAAPAAADVGSSASRAAVKQGAKP